MDTPGDAWADPSRRWTDGRWSADLRDDEIADLVVDGVVVLRSVRAVVRDADWNTVPLAIADVVERAGGLTLRVRAEHPDGDLVGEVRLDAAGDTIAVALELRATAPVATNRTGLVVLHPPALAGTALRVTHSDGSTETTAFPERISPHQPVVDIAALSWTTPVHGIRLGFSGDVFEMEDQRNWTDASFKTYSRPLALPFPYRLAAGEVVRQEITVTAGAAAAAGTTSTTDADDLLFGDPVTMPLLAVAASTAPDPAPHPLPGPPGGWAATLVELDLGAPTLRAALARAAASGRPLDVRLVLSDEDPAALAIVAAELAGLDLARVTAFQTRGDARRVADDDALRRLRAALRDAGVTTFVTGGVRSHFTELNREHHRIPTDVDGIVFSSTPLFHSLGTAQLVESLAMQRLVAVQAVEIAAGRAVHIGPISLRPHVNDVATTAEPVAARSDLTDGYGPALLDAADPRQDAPELAAWTIASAAAFSVPGVVTLSFFEEWGPRGVFGSDGTARPAAEAIALLSALQERDVTTGHTPDGRVWAITVLDSTDVNGGDLLVANLDRVERVVRAPAGDLVRIPAGAWRRAQARETSTGA